MQPNKEQIKSAIRWFGATFGGAIAGFFVAKGWLTSDQVMSVLTSEVFISLVGSAAFGVWGLFRHTETNAVAVVGEIAARPDSPVKAVITEATVEGRELAKAIPVATVVPAGTNAAAAAAAH
jgi:hypothetical protein